MRINLGGKKSWRRPPRLIFRFGLRTGRGAGYLPRITDRRARLIFLGRDYGLPPALSGHQTYWLWGPRGYSGNCLIVLGDSRERLEQLFDRVEYVGTSADNPYALEREISVYICRGAKFGSLEKSLAEAEEVAIAMNRKSRWSVGQIAAVLQAREYRKLR